jgi:glycosyltransferase involved in cell wall biosynthesis/tetratricopeptide (TPR) repeat protein
MGLDKNYYNLFLRLKDEESFSLAQKALSKAILLNEEPYYYYDLALLLQRKGEWWQSVRKFEKALSLESNPSLEWKLAYIKSLEKLKRYLKIVEVFKSFLVNDFNISSYLSYANALKEENKEVESLKIFEKAIFLDNRKNSQKLGIGVFYEQEGDWVSALSAYKKKFYQRELDSEMKFKLAQAYERCYDWKNAEKVYLDAIFTSSETIDFYHRLGMVQERLGQYEDAIESYIMATFRESKNISLFYYRLGYLLDKKEEYKEASINFLLMKKKFLPKDIKEDKKLTSKNRVILSKYIAKQDLIKSTSWKAIAQKSEELKCWNIAEDAYKEYLSREEVFNPDIYFSLGYVLVCQKKYKEASNIFKEQYILQDMYGWYATAYRKNKTLQQRVNYTEYYERFKIEEKLILYENNQGKQVEGVPYEIYKKLREDVNFDEYQHVLVLNDKENIPFELKHITNVVFVKYHSDLYMRYLAQAKYLVNNINFPKYFIRKEGQKYLDTGYIDSNSLRQNLEQVSDRLGTSTISKVVESVFFDTIDVVKKRETLEKKSILVYGGTFLANGITVSVRNLLEQIDKTQYDVTLVINMDDVNKNPDTLAQFTLLNKEIKIISQQTNILMTLEERWIISKFNKYHDLAAEEMWQIFRKAYRREYKRIFGKNKFDLLIDFSGYSQYWTRLFSSSEKSSKVVYLHNDMLEEAKLKYTSLYANFKLYSQYDKLISVSQSVHISNQKHLDIDKDKFAYVNNLLDINSIITNAQKPMQRYEEELFKQYKVFISIGRLSPEKGQLKLIKSFSKVVETKSECRLVILGEGVLKEEMERLIRTLDLEDKVFLWGHKLNAMPYLKKAECFVLSSDHEGQGLVLLEAMTLGQNIISTNVVGSRSVVENGYGLLVENSEDGLFSGMMKFLEEKNSLVETFDYEAYNNDALSMFNNVVITLIEKKEEDIKNSLSLYEKREAEVMCLVDTENKKIENLLFYGNYKFDAENFAGINYLLNRAISKSINNKKIWTLIKIDILDILEDVKCRDESLWNSLKGEAFILKIIKLSKNFYYKLESDFLPYQSWFLFANLFIFGRCYKAYELTRTKARESVLLKKEIPNLSFSRYKITAMLESKSLEEYDVLRNKLIKKDTSYLKKYLLLLGNSELYFNRHISTKAFHEKLFTEKEKSFAEYIKNKSIAIVGPVQSGLSLGNEIDSFDVVVRFNYNGLENFSTKEFGKKTDISFYIVQILVPNKFEKEKVKYMSELDWVIMDTAHKEDDLCFLGVNADIRPRYFAAHMFATTFFKGAPSGIQRVLMDLLRFETSKVKVFNTNLFLENNYAKAYKSRGKMGADYFNFFWHDPLSNFTFLKRLKEYAIIDADEVLSEILQMNENDYIEQLEMRYAHKNIEDKI